MEKESLSTTRVAIKWGAIVGVVVAIYTTIINVSGQFGNQALGYVSYFFILGGMCMAMKEFKEGNESYMTYSEGLGIGSLVSAISGVLSGSYMYIYMTIIDTTLQGQIMEKIETEWEKQGLSPEQMEQASSFATKFIQPNIMFVMAVFGSLLIGFIMSLVVSAIMKHTRHELEI